jgi:hypothetical protein
VFWLLLAIPLIAGWALAVMQSGTMTSLTELPADLFAWIGSGGAGGVGKA